VSLGAWNLEVNAQPAQSNAVNRPLALIMLLLPAVGIFTSCRSSEGSRQNFDQEVLRHSREILDNGSAAATTAENVVVSFPGGSSPLAWALLEVRLLGDATDLPRCTPYLSSTDPETRHAAEMTFVALSKPAQKSELCDLLESADRSVHGLVLAPKQANDSSKSQKGSL